MEANLQVADGAGGIEAAETVLVERVRAVREAAEITQGELAERMTQLGFPMHQTAVAKIERGLRPVRLNEAFALAAALRVPLVDLLLAGTEGTPESGALLPDFLAAAAQRLELTNRHRVLEEQRAVVEQQQADLVSRLKAIDQRETEARARWQEARAREDPQAFVPKEHPPVAIATVKELYANADVCAYPGCDRPLYRVNADGSRTLNSRIAHICARREGGPRWNPEMASGDNRSVDNLLLLCIEHADEIDQPQRIGLYPVPVLHSWKRDQLSRFDKRSGGYGITQSEARKVIRESTNLELYLTANTIDLGGKGGNAPAAGGGGGAAVGKGAEAGPGGPGGPMIFNLGGKAGLAPGAGGGGGGTIDPDSPLFWKGKDLFTFGESSFLGIDGADGGDTTISSMDDERVLLRARGGQGARAGTGIRSKSDKLAVSTLMLANYIEFRENFGYVTGTGFSYYNVLNLMDGLQLNGLLMLECGGTPPGEYSLILEALDPQDNVMSTITFVLRVTKPGDILRTMIKFTLSVAVNLFGIWTIVARHEDRELARLPIVIKQGIPGT